MQVKLHLNVVDLEDTQLHQLRKELDHEFRYRGLVIPPADVKLLALSDFERFLKDVLNEAEQRNVRVPGYTKVPVVPIKPALPPLDDAEMALVETGRHIQAIKHFRDRYNSMFKDGVGLKDAKDHVDAYRSKITLGPTKLPTFPRGSQYGYGY